jgi:formylglycine-generating enzyme required for sulfatase activity
MIVVGLIAGIVGLQVAASFSDQTAAPDRPAADPQFGSIGQVRDDNGLKMKFVWCPAGAFVMGDSDESPNRALLTCSYWLGKYEVTQGQWTQMMETTPWLDAVHSRIGQNPDSAATYVSWDDAMAFCAKLTEQERKAGRLPFGWEYMLPTEAQWEHACRAKSTTIFCFGDDVSQLADYAWYGPGGARGGGFLGVGQKRPNAWGLYDMHGNVWEWCRDSYSERPPGGRNPETKSGDYRVIRGGSLWNGPLDCRSARRDRQMPDHRDFTLGFRVVLSSAQSAGKSPARSSDDAPAN